MNLLLIIGILMAEAQGVTDLGVITERKGIMLEACTNRTDFVRFEVELQALRFPSNAVMFVKTNALLTMEDLVAMPPGPVVMGVKSVCADGAESPMALFRLDVRRDPPKAPNARIVSLPVAPSHVSTLRDAMRAVRSNPVDPPAPNFEFFQRMEDSRDTNQSYSDHMIQMHRFWIEHQGRRNQ